MVYRYLPILRWKRGERIGLKQVSVAGTKDTVPLFTLGADQLKGKRPTKSRTAISAADLFANDVFDTWGTRPFYLDASSLQIVTPGSHPITNIASSCRAVGANLIPATSLTAPSDYQTAVQNINRIDGRGIALRVDLQELGSASHWAPTWIAPLAQTDLIADFADIIGTVASVTPAVIHSFQHLHGAGSWRSVTTAGTSMPENFAGFLKGLHTIPREEWNLWIALTKAGIPYRIDYGDYTTPPLGEGPPQMAWGFPINVRYTLAKDFLVCRGVKTTGFGAVDMDAQLVGHAQSIVSYPARGAINCWADTMIDQIAALKQKPGNLETWVQIGVNRHIELVRSMLP